MHHEITGTGYRLPRVDWSWRNHLHSRTARERQERSHNNVTVVTTASIHHRNTIMYHKVTGTGYRLQRVDWLQDAWECQAKFVTIVSMHQSSTILYHEITSTGYRLQRVDWSWRNHLQAPRCTGMSGEVRHNHKLARVQHYHRSRSNRYKAQTPSG